MSVAENCLQDRLKKFAKQSNVDKESYAEHCAEQSYHAEQGVRSETIKSNTKKISHNKRN